ncbi:hypothetical protein [Gottfriedia luciferensis]|uniref:hypothetical protein n=1 Tax=Gottfriedia luciferensis TaxID=178774 RepID=UPI000B44F352|nr:hypothetical protein [Gottfriedia luciferensis]
MKCNYCGSDVQEAMCSFCGADPLEPKKVQKEFVSPGEIHLTIQELKQYHTYDLLLLLSYARKERTEAYKWLGTFKRINAQASLDENNLKFTEEEYIVLTKRQRVIEELLRDRLGYVPDKITDKMMGEWKLKMEKK